MLGGGGGGGSEFMLEVELVLRKHEAREERSDDVVLILGINARASREVKAAENEEWNEARKERSDDAFYCGGSETHKLIPQRQRETRREPRYSTRRFAPCCRRLLLATSHLLLLLLGGALSNPDNEGVPGVDEESVLGGQVGAVELALLD